MITLKQLLNLYVYDEKETNVGTIDDVAFDKSSGKCLLVIDETAFALDNLSKRAKSVTASNLQRTDKSYPTLIGKLAYSTTGKLLGTVVNATVSKALTLGRISLDNGDIYGRGRIYSINDIVLIRAEKPAKSKAKSNTVHMKICANAQTSVKPANTTLNIRSVRRRYGDFSFLLGKTADKNITNFFGEVMIHSGETVTLEILRQAKISGKLIELCLHAK